MECPHRLDAGNGPVAFSGQVSAIAFADYLDDPRDTSFGLEDFDRFPKGTTCFLAPRDLLLDAFAVQLPLRGHPERERRRPSDPRDRGAERVNIAPPFACVYTPRTSPGSFSRHALHRGVVCSSTGTAGGNPASSQPSSPSSPRAPRSSSQRCGDRSSRRRRPRASPKRCRSGRGEGPPGAEVGSFAALAPLYSVAHGLGMWKGALLALAARTRGQR